LETKVKRTITAEVIIEPKITFLTTR